MSEHPATAFGEFLVAHQAASRILPKGHDAILFTGTSASVKGCVQQPQWAGRARAVGSNFLSVDAVRNGAAYS